MKIETMNDLYIDELRDLYSCESQIAGALPKMIEGAETPKLKDAIKTHLEETRGQIKRLDTIFKDLETKPTGEKCEATAGLLKEADGALSDIGKGVLRDADTGESRLTVLQPGEERFAKPITVGPAITKRLRWNAHLAAASEGGAYLVWDAGERIYFRAVGEAARGPMGGRAASPPTQTIR